METIRIPEAARHLGFTTRELYERIDAGQYIPVLIDGQPFIEIELERVSQP